MNNKILKLNDKFFLWLFNIKRIKNMWKFFCDFDNALSLFKKIKDGNVMLEKDKKTKMNINQIWSKGRK